MKVDRPPVPIVVVLYHREEEAGKMFRQLSRVTGNYSLIIVNNGFDDHGLVKELEPLHYVENLENTGAIRGINQGLDLAEGKYAAVLHSDVLIYDEGWLDHIVEFMDRRPDVGLVGLQGAHTVRDDGHFEFETNIVDDMGLCPVSLRPTWRLTEAAMIDGVGWVMRNDGTRLDERYGLMHCYDLDLSLQYLRRGLRVYVLAAGFHHLIQELGGPVEISRSSRGRPDYLCRVGGDDELYHERTTEQLRSKWEGMLPVTRGFRDEAYGFARMLELREDVERMEEAVAKLREATGVLQEQVRLKRLEAGAATRYLREIESCRDRQRMELRKVSVEAEALKGRAKSSFRG